jgi:hypothetical protein
MAWNQNVFFTRRERLNFKKTPYCIYFYYIGRPRDGTQALYIRHYYYTRDNEIRYEDVEELVRTLARNARKLQDQQDPQPDVQQNLDNIEWTRKSYIVFVRDDDVGFDGAEPIIFDYMNQGIVNHSFFDGWCRDVDLSDSRNGSDTCSALCFINHFKRDQNSDVNPDQRDYMPFRLKYDRGGILTHPDSGGTNLGPPMSPP